jgi:hypothetical protein
MNSLEVKGLQTLSENDLSKIDGGYLGAVIAIGRAAVAAYKIPVVRKTVNTAVGGGLIALGWWSAGN